MREQTTWKTKWEAARSPGGFRDERRGFGVKPSYFLPKPVKVGDEVEVKIEAVAKRGDGIAKKDGFVIFVKGAKEGDTVKVRITDVRPRFAYWRMSANSEPTVLHCFLFFDISICSAYSECLNVQ